MQHSLAHESLSKPPAAPNVCKHACHLIEKRNRDAGNMQQRRMQQRQRQRHAWSSRWTAAKSITKRAGSLYAYMYIHVHTYIRMHLVGYPPSRTNRFAASLISPVHAHLVWPRSSHQCMHTLYVSTRKIMHVCTHTHTQTHLLHTHVAISCKVRKNFGKEDM